MYTIEFDTMGEEPSCKLKFISRLLPHELDYNIDEDKKVEDKDEA